MNRQKLILFILLIVFALALVWGYFKWPRQKSVTALKYPPGSHAQADKKRAPVALQPPSLAESRTLRLDLLNHEQATFTGYYRNIFKPIFINELKELKQKSAAIKPVVPLPPPVKPVPAPPKESPLLLPESPQQDRRPSTRIGPVN